MTAPHCQAAFINAIREEGTKEEACNYLQETWNDLCEARALLAQSSVQEAVKAAARLLLDSEFTRHAFSAHTLRDLNALAGEAKP